MAFEELDLAFMLFGGGAGTEGAEVAAFAGPGIFFTRIEAVFAGGELANHKKAPETMMDIVAEA
jgi:hypothetical protein